MRYARPPKAPISDETLRRLMAIELKIRAADERARESRRQSVAEFDAGCIYVIEFASGMTKVGKTANADSRLSTHARHAEVHDNPIVRSWVSRRHPGCSTTEKLLKRFCALAGTRKTGEYFTGVRFELPQDYALRLARQARNGDRLDEPFAAVNGDMSKTWEQAQAALDDA